MSAPAEKDARLADDFCPHAYVCPKSGEVECLCHGGFDNCCDHPDCPGNVDARRVLPPEGGAQ